jgi:Tfp pilus assembly protein PilF
MLASPIHAQETSAVNWLVVRVKDLSGEGPAGIEQAVTDALAAELSGVEGWKAQVNDLQAEVVRAAVNEGMIIEEEAAAVPDLASARRLGLVWGADTVLIGLLTRRDSSVVLVLNAVGSLGRQAAGPGKEVDIPSIEVKVTEGMTVEQLAALLVEGTAERLLPLVQANRGLWAKDAEYAPAWEAEGDVYMQGGWYRQGRMAFLAAVAADGNSGRCHRKLAEALLSLGQSEKALKHLEKALALLPKDVEILLALGETYLAMGNPGRAAGQFEAAAFLAKDDLRPKEGIARANMLRGNLAAALKAYEELVKAAPEEALFHYGYAEALLKANRPDEAAEQFRLCLDFDPEFLAAREALASLLLKQGKTAEGIEQLRLLAEAAQEPLAYPAAEYQELLRALSGEFLAVLDEFDHRLYAFWDGELTQDQFRGIVEGLNERSENLARLMERIAAPEELDRSHRYWVLAANLLKHSDFEAYRYSRNEGAEYLRRAQLFRSAAREAVVEARALAHASTQEQSPAAAIR